MRHLYLHVPFCTSICYYCDFKRNIYDTQLVDAWLKEIEKEMTSKKIDSHLETIYIGGGTPSCLSYAQLEQLLKIVEPYTKNICEYTIESNLESLDASKISLLQAYKVNRISLGVQSLQDDLLVAMNRKHRRSDVFTVLENLSKQGMHNISVDLIYGLPKQTLAMWIDDLNEIVQNPYIQHISLYSLTIEENSIFYKQGIQLCDNELEADMYEQAIQILEKNGFHHYEIANFAKKGYASLHNQAYWCYKDFYGIGVGASGKERNSRYTIEGSILAYTQGKASIENINLSKKELMFEHIMMSLRMRKGLDIKGFEALYDVDFMEYYKDKIKQRLETKQLLVKDDHLIVSKEAMFYLHDVLLDFMEDE